MGHPHIEKRCGKCREVKPVDQFYSARAGRDGYCRPCRRALDRERGLKKRSLPYDADRRRDYKLRRTYGITLADYRKMNDDQDGACAICGDEERRSVYGETPRLVVDHSHHTGRVRALLCTACNGRLGAIEDEQFALRALEYLRLHDAHAFILDARKELAL